MAKTIKTSEDFDWQIKDDARLIENYSELLKDKTRYGKAIKYLKARQLELSALLNSKKK